MMKKLKLPLRIDDCDKKGVIASMVRGDITLIKCKLGQWNYLFLFQIQI